MQRGDRLLILVDLETAARGTDPSAGAGPADPAAFADLLEQAYEVQVAALD